MKKLSLLVALAMLITVGGVYATWDYAEKLAEVKTVEMPGVIQMTDYTNASSKGTISVDVTKLSVLISDDDDDFRPELAIDPTDYIEIRFVPDKNASGTVKTQGIPLKLWFTLTEGANKTYDYDGDGTKDNIFTINSGVGTELVIGDGESSLAGVDAIEWVKDGDAFVAHVPANIVFGTTSSAAITFNDNVELDTLAKYHAFDSAVNDGRFVLNLAEVATA